MRWPDMTAFPTGSDPFLEELKCRYMKLGSSRSRKIAREKLGSRSDEQAEAMRATRCSGKEAVGNHRLVHVEAERC